MAMKFEQALKCLYKIYCSCEVWSCGMLLCSGNICQTTQRTRLKTVGMYVTSQLGKINGTKKILLKVIPFESHRHW